MSEERQEQSTPTTRRKSITNNGRRAAHSTTTQLAPLERPRLDDADGWKKWWQAKEQPWRTEPEIDEKRQEFLIRRLTILPNISTGIYSFKDVKLTRADVEWLLATHENGRGPVDWSDQKQQDRAGIDLRGAIMQGIDLSYLPLARLVGGIFRSNDQSGTTPFEQRKRGAIHLEGASLRNTHLEGADLSASQLAGADLEEAILEEADLERANLQGTSLEDAHLERAFLPFADLRVSNLERAHLEDANLDGAFLEGASLNEAHLERTILNNVSLSGAELNKTHLEGSDMNGAYLAGKHLDPPDLADIRQWVKLFPQMVPAATLQGAFFDRGSNLAETTLGNEQLGSVVVADVRWGDVNLAVANWSQIKRLGDEIKANQPTHIDDYGYKKTKTTAQRLDEYKAAVRANRQLATALRNQGMNEEADRFSYRAHLLQRVVLRRQQNYVKYLASWFFWLIAGYGYRPLHSLIAYLVIILGFMCLYLVNAHFIAPHLTWDQALVLSVSSFHGRGFFEQDISLGSTYARLAAFEAILGLLIEISFIATFTQRFFGK